MQTLHSDTIWINPRSIPLQEMSSATRVSNIISGLQINDGGCYKSGKLPSVIAQEFEHLLLGLSGEEKNSVQESLSISPLIHGTGEYIAKILDIGR